MIFFVCLFLKIFFLLFWKKYHQGFSWSNLSDHRSNKAPKDKRKAKAQIKHTTSSKKLTDIFKSKLSIQFKPSWMGREEGTFLLRRTQNLCHGKAVQLTSDSRKGVEYFPTPSTEWHTLSYTELLLLSLQSQLESRQKQVLILHQNILSLLEPTYRHRSCQLSPSQWYIIFFNPGEQSFAGGFFTPMTEVSLVACWLIKSKIHLLMK